MDQRVATGNIADSEEQYEVMGQGGGTNAGQAATPIMYEAVGAAGGAGGQPMYELMSTENSAAMAMYEESTPAAATAADQKLYEVSGWCPARGRTRWCAAAPAAWPRWLPRCARCLPPHQRC